MWKETENKSKDSAQLDGVCKTLMQLCNSHHIQCRDIFQDKMISAILELFSTLVNIDEVAQDANRDIKQLTNTIDLEGGCLCCYYWTHFQKDLIELTRERLKL